MTFLRHLGHFDRIAAICELEEEWERTTYGELGNEEIDALIAAEEEEADE